MRIFTQEIIVAPQHIDIQNRVSNLCYVQWMQDLAINHSTVQGWGVDRYEAEGHGWVVRNRPSRSWQTTRKFCSSCRASRHKRQVCLFSVYFPRSPVHDRAGQTAARRAAKENWRPSATFPGGQAAKKGGRRISLPL